MNTYEMLAYWVDGVHIIIAIFLTVGFFVPKKGRPRFQRFYNLTWVTTAITQFVFSFRCPLTLLSGYLRELANPGFTEGGFYSPFVVKLLKSTFGLEVPAVAIVAITLACAGLATLSLLKAEKLIAQPTD